MHIYSNANKGGQLNFFFFFFESGGQLKFKGRLYIIILYLNLFSKKKIIIIIYANGGYNK